MFFLQFSPQPFCVTPSDPLKNLELRLNATINVAEVGDVLEELPLYVPWEQCLRGVSQYVYFA